MRAFKEMVLCSCWTSKSFISHNLNLQHCSWDESFIKTFLHREIGHSTQSGIYASQHMEKECKWVRKGECMGEFELNFLLQYMQHCLQHNICNRKGFTAVKVSEYQDVYRPILAILFFPSWIAHCSTCLCCCCFHQWETILWGSRTDPIGLVWLLKLSHFSPAKSQTSWAVKCATTHNIFCRILVTGRSIESWHDDNESMKWICTGSSDWLRNICPFRSI